MPARKIHMHLNTKIPAIRRGLGRAAIAGNRTAQVLPIYGRMQVSPLTREETRQAVIEILG